jgi:hypothetical protein
VREEHKEEGRGEWGAMNNEQWEYCFNTISFNHLHKPLFCANKSFFES